MHPRVKQLADHFGVKLSDRVCFSVERGMPEDYQPEYALYDGQTLATQIRIAYQVFEKDDHSLLHDIAHYAIASDCQRELPEFGLGTPAYGQPLGITGPWGYVPCIPSVVEESESKIQEHMAQFLCVLWGKAYGISPDMIESPGYAMSWDEYFHLKSFQETENFLIRAYGHVSVSDQERELGTIWQSLIRLQEDGWMNPPLPRW